MPQTEIPALSLMPLRNYSDPSFRPYVSLGALVLPQFVPGVQELRPLESILTNRYAVYFGEPVAIESPTPMPDPARRLRLVDAEHRPATFTRILPFTRLVPIPAPERLEPGTPAYARTIELLQGNLAAGIDVLLAPGWSVRIGGRVFRVLQEPDGSPLLVLATPVAVGD